MAEENNVWKWLLAAGAGVAAWKLWNRSRADDPDVLEAKAHKVLQKDFNPFLTDDLAEQMKAGAMSEEARIRREHAEMEKAGYPIDRKMEEATLEMMRQNHTLGDGWGSCEKLLDASGRLYQEAKKTLGELGHPNAPAAAQRCSYCGGTGWYICTGCHGSGRNRAVPYPNLTGNRAFDAVILHNYQAASTCSPCQGRGQIVCQQCRGTGRS